MVDNRKHPNDVNQSNGHHLTLRGSAEDIEAGNATRRDYPLQSHGKFRVIEKPGVIEAYTISLVSLSTPAVGGNIFTSCLKLIATSAHSERRIRDYPTEIVVIPGNESKAVLGTSVLVKRLILFKQETSLFIKHNYHQDYFKPYNNCHIRSVSVCETSLSNIVMFATDNRKPCYLADENNQCDCRQFLEPIPCERPCEKSCERPREKPCERPCEKPCERPCEKPCERRCEKPCERPCEKPCGELEGSLCPQSTSHYGNQLQVHICMFCGQGFIGGNSCGRVCDEFLKQKVSKNSLKKFQPKLKPPKKRIRFCGCLRKKDKSEEVMKECDLRVKCDRTQRLFARMRKPSEVYIKKPCLAKEQSLNVISCQKSLKICEERYIPEKKCEPMRQPCTPCIRQELECPCRKCIPPQPVQPCPVKCISACSKKTAPHCPSVCQDKHPCGCLSISQEKRNPPCEYSPLSPCGYSVVCQEKQSPPYGYLPTLCQEKMDHGCRCKPPVSPPVCQEKATSCVYNPPVCQEKATPPCISSPPVCLEKATPPCVYNPPVCQEKVTPPCVCNPPVCQEKVGHVCKCLPKLTSKTQIYKSKSEKLVGKRFHLLCQKFESSDEETDTYTVSDKPKSPPINKMYNLRRPNSQESSELSEDIKNDYDEKNKTETKVGRVEINYCKSYYPFKARLQRDNVPFKKQNDSSSTYSSSKPKHSMSSSNSNISYLNIGRKKIKRSKFPVKFEDCRSCYLKVCKHSNKKKTVFCYSSGCSVKKIS